MLSVRTAARSSFPGSAALFRVFLLRIPLFRVPVFRVPVVPFPPVRQIPLYLIALISLAALVAPSGTVHAYSLETVSVSVTALGGTPLLLEITLDDAGLELSSVVVESGDTRLEQREQPIVLAPFAAPGAHELTVELRIERERDRRRYRVAFVDYLWGRDNFSFANDARYRGEVVSYSDLLFPWLDRRFGEISPADRAVLLLEAYDILRGQLGFCYAFSGTAVLYHRYPERLPRFTETIYGVREANRIVREEMSLRQNDIVFQRFVAEGVTPQPQTRAQVAEQLVIIQAGIDRGEPVVVGLLAPERHHSLVVYGYIEELRTGAVTLVGANNWDRDERDNYSNPSVENILVYPVVLEEQPDRSPLDWPGARYVQYRRPTHLVAVEFTGEYAHERSVLDALVERRRQELGDRARRTVLIEGVQSVRLTDIPDSGGEAPPGITRINSNAIVDLPRDGRYELELRALEADETGPGGERLYRPVQLYLFEGDRVTTLTLEMEEPRHVLEVPTTAREGESTREGESAPDGERTPDGESAP